MQGSSPRERVLFLLSYLLTESLSKQDRLLIWQLMRDSELFSDFDFVWNGEDFYSKAMVQSRAGQPMEVGELVGVSLSDARACLREELEFRKKQKISADLISLAQQSPNMGLSELQEKVSNSLGTVKVTQNRGYEVDGADAYRRAQERPLGILTGVKGLDDVVRGLMYGTTTCVFGFVSSGKSTFMLNCTYQAIINGFNVVFITLEVPREQMHWQLMSLHSFRAAERLGGEPIPFLSFMKTDMSADQQKYAWGTVEQDLKSQKGKFVFAEFDDVEDFSYAGVTAYLRALPFFADVVILDYAQQLTPLLKADRFNEKYMEARMVIDFGHIAVGTGHNDSRIVILGAQANREGWLRAEENDGAYDLRAIADINQLERGSYYCISLYTDVQLRQSSETKICLLKNKSGPIIPAPIVSPFDPRFYSIGDAVAGYTDRITNKDLEAVMNGGFDLKSMLGGG